MIKLLGVVLVIAACGGVGFMIAASYRREERSLKLLIKILNYMECELKCRLTPLPELCRMVASEFPQQPGRIFAQLANEMQMQLFPDAQTCMSSVLSRSTELTPLTRRELIQLGRSIGKFDLDGQLKGMELVRMECNSHLTQLMENRDNRLRSYQTLGLCAGAALAILLI